MLINFFFTLRAAKLKVSVKEYLTLLEAIKAGVIDADENHWVLKPRNSKLWYGEFFGWLAGHGGNKTVG